MRLHRGRKAQWTLTSWPAAFLLLAAFGLPRAAQGAVCGGAFDILQKGFCSTTTNQGCQIDADCPVGETCKTFNQLLRARRPQGQRWQSASGQSGHRYGDDYRWHAAPADGESRPVRPRL